MINVRGSGEAGATGGSAGNVIRSTRKKRDRLSPPSTRAGPVDHDRVCPPPADVVVCIVCPLGVVTVMKPGSKGSVEHSIR